MRKKTWVLMAALAASVWLTGCGPKPVDFDLEVKVRLDGQPVADAEVLVDGAGAGRTDATGQFATALARVPGQAVKVEVRKESAKFRAKPWQETFATMGRKEGDPKFRQTLNAELQRYVTIAVQHDGKPVADAQISVEGKSVGATGSGGELEYVFDKWPRNGLRLAAKKAGLGEGDRVYKGESGERVELPIFSEAVVAVEALEDNNGLMRPIKDAVVSVGGREVGRTAANGGYVYRQKGKLGGSATVRISAPGHLPAAYSRTVTLAGSQKIQQYFYSAAAGRPRVAVMGFAANTKGEDIGDVVKKIESSFVQELFDAKAFRQVPTDTARGLIKKSKLNLEKLKTAGWRGTPLAEVSDVLVFGSVARGEDDSYVVEASFYDVNGKLVMTQAAIAGSSGSWRVGRAVGELVSNAVSAYPVAGLVTVVEEDNLRINIGRNQFAIDSDDTFVLQKAKRQEDGRITGWSDSGTLRVKRARDDYSEMKAESDAAPRPGDRVVRLDTSVAARAAGAERVVFAVKGGKAGEESALAGANVYIDQRWVGSTDRKGEVGVPLRLGNKYKLIVYRHGYEQVTRNIEPAKKGERIELALKSFSSELMIESEPSGATVSLDDTRIGSTPISKPYQVTLGFHGIKVDAGGDYRAWEEVIEFNKPEENRTGANKVVLYKDYLKLADRAENARQFDEAIRLYSAAPKEHPDYVELRHRLGQLYLDDKNDADRAVAEFERVQEIPEVRELVFKQYAVVYTNMGKAYYAKGNSLLKSNRNEAMTYLAKAIKALDRARENTRFFPDERHDEAVHDTYYYRALAYHYLYQMTRRENLLPSVEMAWNEYHDFFPPKLRGKPEFEQLRESGEKLARQAAGQ